MPTHRPDLAELSTTELAFLARCKPQTAKRKLAGRLEPVRRDGRTVWWDARVALPMLLGRDSVPDAQAERARLDRLKGDAQEMRNRQLAGELLPEEDVTAAWIGILSALRSRLLAIPTRVAPRVRGARTTAAIETIVRDEIHQALQELSEPERAEPAPRPKRATRTAAP